MSSGDFPKHARQYLRERGLLKKAKSIGIRYFTAVETRKLVGLPEDRKPSDGVGIPLSLRKGQEHWSIRFLRPCAKPKFKQSFKSRNEFLLGYGHDWKSIRRDRTETIYFVEGWNKAHTLSVLGIPAIGLNGVYGWRSAGNVIRDFVKAHWRWKGRTVRICFDSDILWKSDIQQAAVRLYRYLAKRGAEPEIVVIESDRDTKIGPDDLVMKHGAAELSAIPGLKLGQGVTREWAAPSYVRKLNEELAFAVVESQALVLRSAPDKDRPHLMSATLIGSHQAREIYAPQKFQIGEKVYPIFDLWLEHKGRREISSLILDAKKPYGYDPRTRAFNTWQGWTVDPHKPDSRHSWELFKTHLRENIACGDSGIYDYLLQSLAWWAQNPSDPSGLAIVLIGEEGSGKGFVFTQLGYLFGRHYIEIADPDLLLGRFTGHLRDSVVVFLDEAIFAGDRRQRDKLYNLITSETVTVENKGKDAFKMRSHRKYGMATNHDWAVPAGLKSRRFFVLKVSPDHCNDFDYFHAIEQQLINGGYRAMLYELQHLDISDFEIRAIPKTRALWDQKRQSFDPVTEWYFDCLNRGSLSSATSSWCTRGFTARITASAILRDLDDLAVGAHNKHSARIQLGQRLAKLCPAVRHEQSRVEGNRDRKEWTYIFPSLQDCRDAFVKYVGQQVEWEQTKKRKKSVLSGA